MKQRSLEYEEKFKKYLFSFDFKIHNEICKNINVRHNQRVEELFDEEKDIENLTDEELKQQYEIVRRELENRNIEQGLPVLWNY
jgi:ribosomal protein S13